MTALRVAGVVYPWGQTEQLACNVIAFHRLETACQWLTFSVCMLLGPQAWLLLPKEC